MAASLSPTSHERTQPVRFALLADSRTGSTWVNHVLSSHPCIVSSDEYLMSRMELIPRFHRDASSVAEVLRNITEHGSRLLHRRMLTSALAARCVHTAAGVKLKTSHRDVLFSEGGNARMVIRQMRKLGWRLIVLQRRNALDGVLARQSRVATNQLHCYVATCAPFSLNGTFTLPCAKTVTTMNTFEQTNRLIDNAFSTGNAFTLRLDYERLLHSSAGFNNAMRLLGFSNADACLLREEHVKRVQQTQREMIRNFDDLARCLHAAGPQLERHLHADARPPFSGPLPIESIDSCPNETHRDPRSSGVAKHRAAGSALAALRNGM